jgi:hypothetical protein
MIIVASKQPFKLNNKEVIEEYMLKKNYLIQALIDLRSEYTNVFGELVESETDRANRLQAINELNVRLQESETDRANRLKAINDLSEKLQESETDRRNRLEIINELNARLKETEADGQNKLNIINEFNSKIRKHKIIGKFIK